MKIGLIQIKMSEKEIFVLIIYKSQLDHGPN